MNQKCHFQQLVEIRIKRRLTSFDVELWLSLLAIGVYDTCDYLSRNI